MATAVQTRANVIAKMRGMKGKYAYKNNWVRPSLAQMKARKAGDCSDLTHAVFGFYGYKLGGMSNDQSKNGTKVASWKGKRGGGVKAYNKIYKQVKQADIIVMDLVGAGRYTHVETITANKSGNSIGHGWGVGPKEQNLGVSWLLPAAYSWEIRRIIPDDKKATNKQPARPKVIVKGVKVKTVQKQLKRAGFFTGKVDGKPTQALWNAICKYQTSQVYRPGLKTKVAWGPGWQKHYKWVLKLQRAINKWKAVKPKLYVRGHYHANTRSAVKKVQTRNFNGTYRKAVRKMYGAGYRPVIDSKPGKAFCKMVGIKLHPYAK